MARSKNVDSWISEHDPAIRQICSSLRDIILEVDPNLKETIKWGNPVYEKKEKVFYLSATDYYVHFGIFKGALIDDPTGRIVGTGKGMRHVKVRALEDINRPQFESWMQDALALDGE